MPQRIEQEHFNQKFQIFHFYYIVLLALVMSSIATKINLPGAQLVNLLESLTGSKLSTVTLPLNKMVPGNHRPISKSGLALLRESYQTYGALPESVFIVQEKTEGKYEIIEGNHRKMVWEENGYGVFHPVFFSFTEGIKDY